MNITRHNYEEYFLLYVDNELSAAERDAVEEFVQNHPDLEKELKQLQQFILSPEKQVVYTNIEGLLKPLTGEVFITAANYEAFFILYADDELSNEEKAVVEEFVYHQPQYQAEFELIQQVRVTPDSAVVFLNKESLYRKEEDDKVIPFRWWRMAAAALVLLVAGILWLNNRKQSITKPVIARQDIPVKQHPLKEHMNAPSARTIETTPLPGNDLRQPKQHLAVVKDKEEDKVTHPAISSHSAGKDQKLLAVKTKEQKAGQDKAEIFKEGKELKSSSIGLTNKKIIEIEPNKGTLASVSKQPNIDQPATILNPDENTKTNAAYASLNDDNVELLNTTVSKKNSLRGFLRKASRFISKKTNVGDQDGQRKGILIGGFEIAVK